MLVWWGWSLILKSESVFRDLVFQGEAEEFTDQADGETRGQNPVTATPEKTPRRVNPASPRRNLPGMDLPSPDRCNGQGPAFPGSQHHQDFHHFSF